MERTSTLMVLSEKNLSDYRAWLKDIREKVRAEKGRLTEAHLIGELVKFTVKFRDKLHMCISVRSMQRV